MNIIVFDTETIGKVSQNLINVGYKIVDLNIRDGEYKTLVERDYLINRFINNKDYCLNDDFVGLEKYKSFLYSLSQKESVKRSLKQVFTTMKNDLKRHGVLFGYAYNCRFDIDKFKTEAQRNGLENPLEKLPIFDIWDYSTEYICKTDDYLKWSIENEIYTESMIYLSTSVENVCKYLYQDLEFTERHTALNDTQHELYILLECVKRGCDITRPLKSNHFIKSGKVFEEELKLPNGEIVNLKYKKKCTRNGKTTYSME